MRATPLNWRISLGRIRRWIPGARECVGDDLNGSAGSSFSKVTKLKPGETLFLSWIVYRSKQHRDSVNAKVLADPRIARMIGEGAESVRRLVARQRPVGPPYSLVREFRDLFERADMLPGGYDFIHLVFWGVVSMVIVGTNLLPIALSMGIGILLFETLFRKG